MADIWCCALRSRMSVWVEPSDARKIALDGFRLPDPIKFMENQPRFIPCSIDS